MIELNSKVLSYRLLDGLGKVAEEEAKKYLGQPHVRIMAQPLHWKKFTSFVKYCKALICIPLQYVIIQNIV